MTMISNDEIDLLSKYILTISGLKLDHSKGYLLENRLKPILRAEGIASYRELLQRAAAESDSRLKSAIIDAISTNETFFFRDNTPFELLKNKIIPDILDRRAQKQGGGPGPLRIWSAACSTGQEVYSIAITLLEMLPPKGKYDIFILGTDISDQAVARASYGQYTQFEVERGLPGNIRRKYFNSVDGGWRIRDEVRSLVKFEKVNLMRPLPDFGKFDVVFCRNVAIYFGHADKIKLFQKIGRVMRPDGALLVGGSENLAGIAPDFTSRKYLRGIYYELKSFDRHLAPERVTPASRPVRRKMVYDRPRKKIVPVEVPAGRTGKRAGPDNTAKKGAVESKKLESVDSRPAEKPAENRTPVSLSAKLSGQQAGNEKGSLLSAIQKKKQGSSLLGAKQVQSGAETSLLDNITSQGKKKDKGGLAETARKD